MKALLLYEQLVCGQVTDQKRCFGLSLLHCLAQGPLQLGQLHSVIREAVARTVTTAQDPNSVAVTLCKD